MDMAGVDFGRPRGTFFAHEPNLSQLREPLGEIRQDFGGHLAAPAPRPQDTRERQQRRWFQAHYSRISSVRRFLSFIPAAPRMVRMDFAVRPCLPITLPRSVG